MHVVFSWQVDLDLEKTAFLDCCESSIAVDTSSYGLGISPITSYIRKVVLQPAELWLASAHSNAVGTDQFEVVSTEDVEASAASGFIRYVEAVSAEPLEYWLCPNCEMEFPNTDEISFEDVAAESANCAWMEPESNVASVISCLHRVLCKPDSFWLINCPITDSVSNNSMKLDSPLCSSLSIPHTTTVLNNPQPEQSSGRAIDFWLPKSSSENNLDNTGAVINDANGMTISSELESAIKGYLSGNIVSSFSNDYYLAILKSKPANYWLCNGNQKLLE